ncbi:MAG: RsfS/YbeB/iojap family protein, partial [Firmicutes bacterium]|nr:RsfS/YbeB/iojap family protein [Bacillota bacterium]
MTSKEIAIKAAEILHNKGAHNITVLDVSSMTVVTEAMVIAAGRNVLQARALAEDLEEQLQKTGISPIRKDGHPGSRWVVL